MVVGWHKEKGRVLASGREEAEVLRDARRLLHSLGESPSLAEILVPSLEARRAMRDGTFGRGCVPHRGALLSPMEAAQAAAQEEYDQVLRSGGTIEAALIAAAKALGEAPPPALLRPPPKHRTEGAVMWSRGVGVWKDGPGWKAGPLP